VAWCAVQVGGEKLDYDAHVKPLIERFRRIDWGHSGQLTHDDLLRMVEMSRQREGLDATTVRRHGSHSPRTLHCIRVLFSLTVLHCVW
jgi:hypothetical protein